jgi:hypothetical protein
MNFLTFIFVCLFSISLMATESPQQPFSNAANSVVKPVSSLGDVVTRTVHAQYDFSVDGGSSTIGGIDMHAGLPKGALIKRAYYYVTTQLASSGFSGTNYATIDCEDSGNIKAQADLNASAAGSFVEGASTGTAATMKTSIAANCRILLNPVSSSYTAGKLDLFIDYVLIH